MDTAICPILAQEFHGIHILSTPANFTEDFKCYHVVTLL